jgi:hypothetical protein
VPKVLSSAEGAVKCRRCCQVPKVLSRNVPVRILESFEERRKTVKRAKAEFKHSNLYKKEDWWACWIGFIILALCVPGIIGVVYKLPKIQTWGANPLSAFTGKTLLSYAYMFVGLVIIFLIAVRVMGEKVKTFVPAFFVVFIIAIISIWIGSQKTLKSLGFSYQN